MNYLFQQMSRLLSAVYGCAEPKADIHEHSLVNYAFLAQIMSSLQQATLLHVTLQCCMLFSTLQPYLS